MTAKPSADQPVPEYMGLRRSRSPLRTRPSSSSPAGALVAEVVDGQSPTPVHSNYFNPDADRVSAENIAAVVAGQPDLVVPEKHR
ncbi:hypothetical protein J7E88_33640 [Streptomyces sp. ISL-10]|uniref:hypothetical protein n=1 Tax=Streptomyces sp. ISL-10 TaxID=2819172 RepID=UPI001BEAC6D3|nr:hypothetical protein [Streptomyces sp. ISL-10]MBT2370081.1 hypothetical protein [Streptomyces sp. ISL-10]